MLFLFRTILNYTLNLFYSFFIQYICEKLNMEQDRKFIIQCAFILILFLSVIFYIWYDMTHQDVKVQQKPKKQHSEYFYEWHEDRVKL